MRATSPRSLEASTRRRPDAFDRAAARSVGAERPPAIQFHNARTTRTTEGDECQDVKQR